MEASFFARGLLIGFSIAAVVGPIGILCIQRTLHKGFFHGLATGLGAATADATYGSIAAFGLGVVSGFLVSQQTWIRTIGGLFLVYLGIKAILTRPATAVVQARSTNAFGAYVSALLLTLTNPLTILSFVAIFAGLGVGISSGGYLASLLVVVGVFCGSGCWWLLLCGGVSLLRERLSAGWLVWINRGAGISLVIFGIIALIGLIR